MNLNFRRITPEIALDTFEKINLRPSRVGVGDGNYDACLIQAIVKRHCTSFFSKLFTFIHLTLQLGPDYIQGVFDAWDGAKRPTKKSRRQLGFDDTIAIRKAFQEKENIRHRNWLANKPAKVHLKFVTPETLEQQHVISA